MSDYHYEIIGSDLQMVELSLGPRQAMTAEAGSMVFMDEAITMKTNTGGGLLSGVKRFIGGAGFFLTHFTNEMASSARVGFAAPYPGKVIAINLSEHGGQLLAQKDAFLCATADTEIDVAFTKRFGAGLFGGNGFILQKISGNNLAFIHAGGTLIKKELSAGEVLHVDSGCLAAFESSVDFQAKMIKGVSNILFGGEGVFLAKLTGPGKVYIQSMPFYKLAGRIISMIPNRNN